MTTAVATRSENREELVAGEVERVVFRAANDWSVLRINPGAKRPLATIVGYSSARVGEQVSAHGVWKNTEFGVQLEASAITAVKPTSAEGIVRYLASGVLPGVGPATAQAIVATFGTETIKVLDDDPGRLTQVRGLGKKKLKRIIAGWAEQRAVAEIMLFLHEHEIAPYLCRRIYKKYEARAIDVIGKEPYRLALEVSGVGFKTADRIAAKVGIPRESPQRVRAGLVYVMQEATSTGNCGVRRDEFVGRAVEALEVPAALVEQVLGAELAMAGREGCYLEQHGEAVYLSMIARCEELVAKSVLDMLRKPVAWQIDAESAIAKAERDLGFKLARQQREGVRMMLASRFSVLTGLPGTGKTTVLNTLLHIFKAHKIPVHLAAPTGKAAQRASEVTGFPASTIHRLLGLKAPGVEPIEVSDGVVVIDESSMNDIYLMTSIMKSTRHVSLILVGDVDQLPSVGPGQVLADLIDSGAVPVTRLTEVFRQAAGSLIIRNAHAINQGRMPQSGGRGDDFFFIQMKEKDAEGHAIEPSAIGSEISRTIVDLVAERLPKAYGFDPIRDIMVLSPMNITNTGVGGLNAVLQERLNPHPARSITRMGVRFGVGDKVIQTRNNYDLDIFNGDVGIITRVDDEDEDELHVDFSGHAVQIPFDEMDSLRLAYCMTIHKSQGSQADAVVIPVSTQHYTMLQRNLYYTAVTRAKRLVVLVGVARAMAIAVRKVGAVERLTRLKELLAGAAA